MITPFDLQLPDHARGHVLHVVLVGAAIVCRNCPDTGCSVHDEPGDAFRHLLHHAEAGHRVRRGLLEGLAVASAVLTAREGK